MLEEERKSFDFAADLIKQVLTLSSAIIAVTVSAAKFLFASASADVFQVMFISWASFIVCILFGFFAYMSLTGELARPKIPGAPHIYTGKIRFFMTIHLLAFFIGIIFVALFAYAGQECTDPAATWLCKRLL
ncbi:hypothetical protein FQV27_13085 [Paracoccus aurantiacus]|uniref:Uncharacterized protein n=1 Tax=Paracoccus aurantiacus TaxID=2599412 RepID=A0A5C6S171_9RHOB|nr:hypothetical protein [Paracoccus aurantiacus]TXB68113.1 hypothetical protein FQV27_13085 [Paracoccus aurantiacus]